MARNPLDRSAAFTALLELDPEGFGKQDMDNGGKTITNFLEDFHESGSKNMFTYAQSWLAERQEAAQRAAQAPAAEAPEEAGPADGAGDWRVTAQVHRAIDGWESSRQVPTFIIPRWLAPTREDAEAKAQEIVNPFGERYGTSMEIWAPEAGSADVRRQALEAARAEGERHAAMVRAYDAAGIPLLDDNPPKQAQPQAERDERQVMDWNEHNAIVDGMEPEAGQ